MRYEDGTADLLKRTKKQMLICLKPKVMIMDITRISYDFTAQIFDDDTGALIVPDYECRLTPSIEPDGSVVVMNVWLEDANNRNNYIDANSSKSPWVARLATIIREQAEENEDWCDMVREDQGFQYPNDDYVEQHRLRAGDVLAGHAF